MRIWEKAGDSTPPRDRRSPGWRRSPATGRSTRFAAYGPPRWRTCPTDSSPPPTKSIRSRRASAPNGWPLCSIASSALDEEKREAVLLAYYRGFSREALARRFDRADADDQDLAAPRPRPVEGLPVVMTVSPDDDLAAAEFALGTLDPGERATLAARRLREPELDAAIRAWEERLSPLAEAAPPIEPPRDYLPAIEARLRSRRPRRRRAADGVADASAAPVALARGGDRRRELGGDVGDRHRGARSDAPSRPREFVAVLQKSADSPAFVASINLDARRTDGAPRRRAAAAGQVLRVVDHRSQARRAALARRPRRRRSHAKSQTRRL